MHRRMLALALIVLVLLPLPLLWPLVHAQDQARIPISVANAAELELLAQRGRGRIFDLRYWPQDQSAIVMSSRGVWRLPLDGAAPEEPLVAQSLFDAWKNVYTIGEAHFALYNEADTRLSIYDAAGNLRNAFVLDIAPTFAAFGRNDAELLLLSRYESPQKAGGVHVYDWQSGALLREFPLPGLGDTSAADLQNGVLAVAGMRSILAEGQDLGENSLSSRELFAMDIESGAMRFRITDYAPPLSDRVSVSMLRLNADASRLVVAHIGSLFLEFDVASGEMVQALELDSVSVIEDGAFIRGNPKGDFLFVETRFAETDGWLSFADFGAGEALRSSQRLGAGYLHHLSTDPAGQIVVTGGYSGEVWLYLSQTERFRLLAADFAASSDIMAVLPDNETVISAGFDGAVRRWNPDGSVSSASQDSTALLMAVLSPDASRLVTVSNFYVRVWDSQSLQILAQSNIYGQLLQTRGALVAWPLAAYFNDDQSLRQVLVPMPEGVVQFFDPLSGQFENEQLAASANFATTTANSSDTLAILFENNAFVRLAFYEDGKRQELETDLSTELDIKALAYSADDSELWALVGGCRLLSLATDTGKTVGEMQGEDEFCSNFALSPIDPDLALIQVTDGNIALYNIRTGERLTEAVFPSEWGGLNALFSPDGSRIFMSSYDGTITVWGLP